MENINKINKIRQDALNIRSENEANSIDPKRNANVYLDSVGVVKNFEVNKQNKTDNELITDNKDVVSAINEIKSVLDRKIDMVDGFCPDDKINPLQNQQTYFTTPAKDNTIGFTGKLAPIEKEDFMIEVVANLENNHIDKATIFLGNIDKAYYECGGIRLYKGSKYTTENAFQYVTFDAPHNSALLNTIISENSIFHTSKLIHIVIGRSGTQAFALVNGVFYRKTQSEVLTIANNVTIANAKKFARLRKFNFCDESFAMKLWNNGDWDGVRVGNEYRGDLSKKAFTSVLKWVGSNGSIVRNDDNTYTFTSTSLVDPLLFSSNNIIIEKNCIYRIMYRAKSSVNISSKIAYIAIGNSYTTQSLLSVQTVNVDTITQDWNDFIITLDTSSIREEFFGKQVSFMISYANIQGVVLDLDISNSYIEKLGVQDEFLPQSFTKFGAINLASGENLTATNSDQITFGYEKPYSQHLSGESNPTNPPDFIGQTYTNTTSKTQYTAFGTATINDWKV